MSEIQGQEVRICRYIYCVEVLVRRKGETRVKFAAREFCCDACKFAHRTLVGQRRRLEKRRGE